MIEKIVLTLAVLILLAFMASGCIQDFMTPAYLDPDAKLYVDEYENVNPFFTSLFDAKRLQAQINHRHQLNQKQLQDAIGDDVLYYSYVKDTIALGIQNASELRDNIFSPSSPIGMLFPAFTGVAIGWLGLSKPSDKKKLNGSS